MVIGFAKDNLHWTEGDLAKLAEDIREGDISVVLREYEKEIKVSSELYLLCLKAYLHILIESFEKRCSWYIKKEFKRKMLILAYIGDLLQTILIQVQKTKVDVDLAMSALDKLLRSNELNFAFLGSCDI